MALGLSARATAKAMGVTHPAVLEAAKNGRISRLADGTFDLATVQREWSENTDVTKPRNIITGNPGGRNGKPDDHAEKTVSRAQVMDSIQRSRMAKAHWEAREQKVKTEELEGLVVRSDEVKKEVFEMTRRFRDRLLAVADRLGPVMAGISDVPLAIKTLREEMMIILDELSGGKFSK